MLCTLKGLYMSQLLSPLPLPSSYWLAHTAGFFFELSQMDLICATLRFMFVWVFFVCVAFFFFFQLKNETCLSSHAEHGSRKRLIALSSSTSKTNTKHWGKARLCWSQLHPETKGQILSWCVNQLIFSIRNDTQSLAGFTSSWRRLSPPGPAQLVPNR